MRNLLIVLALATASFSSFGSANNLIVNFSKVNEGIYRGARLKSVEDAQYLKTINVKNVINLQG
ncbi:MAG: hypothetical protein ACXVCE_15810, partial [Bacteriovorax sp.]